MMTTSAASRVAKHETDRPRASLRQIRPEYQRNGLTHVVYFTHATHHPSDVFACGREAGNCFEEKRYLATITMASAMVEVILNKDSRMRISAGGWRTLTMKLVRAGQRNGVPVDRLFDAGEGLTTRSIAFIELRNRIAHGNLTDLVGFEHSGTPDYSPEAREVALKHLAKAENFVVEWYNTSPDVQDRRIMRHRWPTISA
jgi:hypothetical protein